MDAGSPDATPRLVHAREPGSVCFVEHHGTHFYAVVNGHGGDGDGGGGGGGSGGDGGGGGGGGGGTSENYTLVRFPDTSSSSSSSRETVVGPADLGDASIIDDLDVFSSALVLYERDTTADASSGPRLRIVRAEAGEATKGEGRFEQILAVLPSGATTVSAGSNAWFDAAEARVSVASPLHADVACACPLSGGRGEVEEKQPVTRPLLKGIGPGSDGDDGDDNNRSNALESAAGVECEVVRLLATSPGLGQGQDPASVPITVIRPAAAAGNSNKKSNTPAPLLLHVYGAYGQVLETSPFRPEWAPLLSRGWTLAFAHVRGGGEMGTEWHAAGRRLRKENTFCDLEAAAEHLCDEGLTEPSLLAGHGTSAGGLALGVLARRRPDLFRALVMRVPFLDVSGTMHSLSQSSGDANASPAALAVHEIDEWGDPETPEELACIEGYCPMLTLERELAVARSGGGGGGGGDGSGSDEKNDQRPAILVTAATNDQRVPFHEPVQWIWGQRELDGEVRTEVSELDGGGRGATPMALNVRYGAGHFGAGGRGEQNEEAALEQAFLHAALGLEMS